MPKKSFVITIDGPAGSGKTTTAKIVAKKLDFLHLDSGAMYRAATWYLLNKNLINSEIAGATINTIEIDLREIKDELNVFVNEQNITRQIREPKVTDAIGPVAANPAVRQILIAKQRRIAAQNKIVAEGRDMGTVVFPDANLKIYMIASIEERAKRRLKELSENGIRVDYQQLVRKISERDADDMNRNHGPLKKADGAIELDTTILTFHEQVDFIVKKARELGA